MSIWQMFKNFATSERGEVINRIDDSHLLSQGGTVYTHFGNNIVGSDGSVRVQVGGPSGDMKNRHGVGHSLLGGQDMSPSTWITTHQPDAGFGMNSGPRDDGMW